MNSQRTATAGSVLVRLKLSQGGGDTVCSVTRLSRESSTSQDSLGWLPPSMLALSEKGLCCRETGLTPAKPQTGTGWGAHPPAGQSAPEDETDRSRPHPQLRPLWPGMCASLQQAGEPVAHEHTAA